MSQVRILVVEDESVVAKDIQWSLKSLGYSICAWASSGEEALEKVEALKPDLVLMDIVLKGGVDGVEAAERIRTNFDIPVVYLTAYADEHTLQRAKVTEPFGYILKPFEERELHTTIEVALYKHKMERRIKESQHWLATTLKSISDGVITTNTQGHVTFLNVNAEALSGWKESEALGKGLNEIFSIKDSEGAPLPDSPWLRSLREGVVVGPASHLLISRGKTTIPIDYSAAPIRDERGNVSGMVLAFRDVTERKKAELLLRREKETFVAILQKAPYGVILFERTGKYLYVNPQFTLITGYSLKDIPTGKDLFHKAYPDATYRKKVIRTWVDDAVKGKPIDRIFSVHCKNGQVREIEMRTTVLDDGRNILTASDITERKLAEEALRASEEKYRELVQNANSIILRRDVAGNITFFNEFAEKFFGFTEDEMLGKNVIGTIVPEKDSLGKSLAAMIKDVGRRPEKYSTNENENMLRSGERVWISWTNRPILDAEGNVREILCVGNDVTERRRAEEALRLQAQIIEQIHDSVISTDLDGHITIWNKGAERLYGYAREEAIGKHGSLIYPEDQWQFLQETVIGPLKAAGSYEVEVRNKKKSGEEFRVHLSLSVLRDNSGAITGLIGYHMDITEHRKLEEQLRHSQKMEAIGQLAGGIAHDFNNILTAVIGYANLLQMRLGEGNQLRGYVDQIIASSERAANLTQSLLAFGRKQILDPKAITVNEIIKGMEKLLGRLISEDIELKIGLSDKDLTVFADAAQMGQVLMNLVTNARDAMPEGGVLTISTGLVQLDSGFVKRHGYGKQGMYGLISVSDTGVGMNEKTRQRVFEPFFTTKEVGKGTGLGLAIVYGIVKQHNGFANVYSELGQGSTLKVYLPLIRSAYGEEKQAPLSPPVGGKETILVAEDDAEVRRLTKNVLEEFGYTVVEAVDGEDAISKFLKHKRKVDLVMLDVVMPRKNGKEVYLYVRKIRPDVKALFTSGYTADVIHEKGVLDEGLNFISKPVAPTELLRKIRNVLDQ
jgi:two-component system cell cycle sensor histidine kinase/response regulator CckA